MKYLRKINESNSEEYIASLRDALTELSDDKKIHIDKGFSTKGRDIAIDDNIILVYIKLDNQDTDLVQLYVSDMHLEEIEDLDLDRVRKSNEEMEDVLKLLKEAVERSQINYKMISIKLIYEKWSKYIHDEGSNEPYSDILVVQFDLNTIIYI